MKFLLIAAAVVAVAVAVPFRPVFPVSVGPAIVDEYHPIHVGPEIVDEYHPIHVGPEMVDEYHPIHVGPEIVDFPIPEGAMDPTPIAPAPVPASSPLVQIIVNVQQAAPADIVNPVVVPEDHPVDIVDVMPVVVPEEYPADIIDVMPVLPVLVPEPEPINVAPGIVVPVIPGPEILN